MAKVHDIGSHFYFQKLFYHTENPPLFDTETTQEIEYPYRRGTCLVLRVPASRVAFVLGRWREELPEKDALLAAMQGRVTKENTVLDEEW